MVNADVGEAAALLGRRNVEEPLQLIQILLREILQENGILDLLGCTGRKIRPNMNTPSVPARRLLTILEAEYLPARSSGSLPSPTRSSNTPSSASRSGSGPRTSKTSSGSVSFMSIVTPFYPTTSPGRNPRPV